MVGSTVSHFRIVGELGQGGMGVVYRAEDTSLGRLVALKFLPRSVGADETERERFYHEARAAAAINHPHVVTIYEAGEHEGRLFLAMECVEGRTLKALLAREPLPVTRAMEIAIQIAQALAAAHEQGVVHRDIKPENILITPKGDVKVADFGVARLQGATKITQAGSTLGTFAYMSPEQARGEDVDHRTDIFSLGVVLYELLSGRPPFRGDHQAALLYSLINEEPAPIARFNPGVTPDLERIVAKALAKDPADRYQHADEMAADLQRERRHLDALRMPPPPPADGLEPGAGHSGARQRKPVLRYVIPAALVAAAVIALVVLNPFNFQLTLQQGKAAEEGASLAVLFFQNIPDPDDKDHTGDMLTDLLTTALSQDKRLQVVSRERLYDILKEMGQAQTTVITPALAQRVAERAGVSMMLLGSILQAKPSLSVTAHVVNVRTGNIITSQRLSGFSSAGLFGLVDTLATLVRGDVVPGEAPTGAGPSKSVAEVTTTSQEAYRLYMQGVDLGLRFLTGEAKAALGRAIELDSTFAMAYFALGSGETNQDDISRRRYLQKAWSLREKTTEKERLRIEAEYLDIIQGKTEEAARVLERFIEKFPYEILAYDDLADKYGKLGQYDRTLQTKERSIRRDSLRPAGWNSLAYSYAGFNREPEALSAVNRYIELMPWEANPYDSKGEIFMVFGQVDSAVAYYRKAVAIRPDFNSAEKLGLKMLLDGKYDEAQRYFRQFGSSLDPAQNMTARMDEIHIQTHQGKLRQAQRLFLRLLPEIRREKLDGQEVATLQALAVLARESGDNAAMLDYARQLANAMRGIESEPIGGRDLLAEALQRNGDAAGSARVLAQAAKNVEGNAWYLQRRHAYGLAEIALAKGEYDRAVDLFRQALESQNSRRAPQIPFGIALLKAGRLDEAVTELQGAAWWIPISFAPLTLQWLPSSIEWPVDVVKAHYWLGTAYELQGRKPEAKEEFRKFLTTWRDADFPSAEMKDARIRLARLGGEPVP